MTILGLGNKIMTEIKNLSIIDGPNKNQLWRQAPIIDDWVSSRSKTQMAVQFYIGSQFASEAFNIYLKMIKTIENDPNIVLFYGQTVDPITGNLQYVEGQYNLVLKTGIAEVHPPEDVYKDS
jgi:hypothetical protein